MKQEWKEFPKSWNSLGIFASEAYSRLVGALAEVKKSRAFNEIQVCHQIQVTEDENGVPVICKYEPETRLSRYYFDQEVCKWIRISEDYELQLKDTKYMPS
jgi:hypothetical protein